MADVEERLAILEEQSKQQSRDIIKMEASLDHRILLMQRDLADIKEAIAKQKGFWAGVTFVASVIGFALAQLWGHIKGVTGS